MTKSSTWVGVAASLIPNWSRMDCILSSVLEGGWRRLELRL